MTILDALLALHPYPLDPEAVRLRVLGRGMHPSADFSPDLATEKSFLLAKADVLMLLAYAPNVSQEGVSYSIVDNTRQKMQAEAEKIYRLHLDPNDPLYPKRKPRYGYKGSLLKG